jgi:hypothetical protein
MAVPRRSSAGLPPAAMPREASSTTKSAYLCTRSAELSPVIARASGKGASHDDSALHPSYAQQRNRSSAARLQAPSDLLNRLGSSPASPPRTLNSKALGTLDSLAGRRLIPGQAGSRVRRATTQASGFRIRTSRSSPIHRADAPHTPTCDAQSGSRLRQSRAHSRAYAHLGPAHGRSAIRVNQRGRIPACKL